MTVEEAKGILTAADAPKPAGDAAMRGLSIGAAALKRACDEACAA